MKEFNPFVLAFDDTKISLRVDVWERSKKLGEVSVILKRKIGEEVGDIYYGFCDLDLTSEEEEAMVNKGKLIASRIWE